jgi:hypothetical protein
MFIPEISEPVVNVRAVGNTLARCRQRKSRAGKAGVSAQKDLEYTHVAFWLMLIWSFSHAAVRLLW